MPSASVGMRCPDCARQRTKVQTVRQAGSEPRLTLALIAANVVVFVIGGGVSLTGGITNGARHVDACGPTGGSLPQHGALCGPSIADGHEYWRIVTSGFLHANVLHILFNMYLLYVLGQMLEPALGSWKFGALYLASLLAGSFGALLATPDANTIGASGAVFGLMGAAAVELRARSMSIMQSGIGFLIAINLLFSVAFPGISLGGHVGGLVGGALAALGFQLGARARSVALQLAGCLVIAAAAVAGSIAVASGPGLSG